MTKRITIDPITRLEGHGKIEIFLDDTGNVEHAYLQIPELRGFEKFCEGRPAEEMPRITARICGVCPESHHLASVKALDMVWNVDPTPAAKKLRELFYCAHIVHSHTAHFYALSAPDFVVGPGADKAERNILGLINKVGLDTGKEVIKNRAYAQKIQAIIGGKATHPSCALPGGLSKALSEEERKEIEEMALSLVKHGEFSVQIFNDVVLQNKEYVDLILSDTFSLNPYSMGMVDENNKLNFYDGKVRVMDPEGNEYAKFDAKEYNDFFAEHVEEWTYLKFPYLKKIGWKGLIDGKDSSFAWVGPLGRLNACDGLATPKAQAAYEQMFKVLGKPATSTLAHNWARVIEILYAAERLLELVRDPEITSTDVRNIPTEVPTEGIGIVEAPRGTLVHHYVTDELGLIKKANLVVATAHGYGPMNISIDKAAKGLIKNGEVNEAAKNMVEMAFRAYDPCFGCATHTLPGGLPLIINVYDPQGEKVMELNW
ncbi:F420-non-reducing hydrogenase subunit A [Desulfonispora thiosulfatigenes DSM 11270]|uniref:F420-non-reducing hydrogenase subunit A n=1 Tax=Desulfonispora thiosulfatigenes DSM 11270 TaxID=656914 RepID=A0A1W1VSW9_DESTI|nr:Ni/Fe hydrogenase subunit alpha [Desulfonispora thiosulfatigenes]SMB96475.1 F420-non-reducing hydrogenase subunit A [Desulfonispora thiosulfatigenes DSM 11270]